MVGNLASRLAVVLLCLLLAWLVLFPVTPSAAELTVREQQHQKQRLKVVRSARSLLGVPYIFGGSGRSGVDCSGLTRYAYRAINRALPHLAAAQARLGRRVARRNLKPGDIVIFNDGGHAALYVGKGHVIAASSARGRVIRQPLGDDWLRAHFDQGRRLIG